MRTVRAPLIWMQVLLIAHAVGCQFASADMVVFQNGERRYGAASYIGSTSDIVLVSDNSSKQFRSTQIREIVWGIDGPIPSSTTLAAATVPGATETYIPFASGGSVFDITGASVYRKTMTNNDGREFILDVEEFFDVPIMRLYPTTYSFFGRRGCFFVALLKNREPLPWHPAEFRVKFFKEDGTLLTSKDFYVYRLPGKNTGARVVEVEFPDVPYELVKHITMIRKW